MDSFLHALNEATGAILSLILWVLGVIAAYVHKIRKSREPQEF